MVSPTIILLPLYIYPSPNAWNFVTSSITANPNVQFNIIVNPNSGPGAGSYPDSSYIAGITALNKKSNVKLLGYVPTDYGNRKIDDIKKDISVYAGWSKYPASKGDLHVSGIFFDEVSSTASKPILDTVSAMSSYTKTKLGAGKSYVVLNPGVQVDKAFFNYADMVVVWEDAHSAAGLTKAISETPTALRKKSAFILHHFTGNPASQTNVVNKVASSKIGSLFITTGGYETASTMWSRFCSAVTAAK